MSKTMAALATLGTLAVCVVNVLCWGLKFYAAYGLLGSIALWLFDYRFMQVRVCEVWLQANPNERITTKEEIQKVGKPWYVISFLTMMISWPVAFVSYLMWRGAMVNEIES